MNILYVEDDDNNAFVMRHLLRGHSLAWAQSPLEGRKMAEETLYDLVLMDINLGDDDCDGVDLMHLLKTQIEGYAQVPFFAVTAYAMEEDEAHFLKAGFDRYFAKPVSPNLLREAVSQHEKSNSSLR